MLLEAADRLDVRALRVGEDLLHLLERLRRADAGDDVLALCVDEELAEDTGSPVDGSRVKATPVADVSPLLPNTIWTTFTAVPRSSGCRARAVDLRARGVPRLEDRLDRAG